MIGSVGALSIPVNPSENPIGDPSRLLLANFLSAHLSANLGCAWAEIGGGTQVVERIDVNDPSDNTFHTSKLPLLCVYREKKRRSLDRIADGISSRPSTMVALWIPPPAAQNWKAKREPFSQAVEAAFYDACLAERTPNWIIPGDTDPMASTKGSHIGIAMGLLRPLAYDLQTEDIQLRIEMLEEQSRSYPGVKMTLPIWEDVVQEPRGVHPNTAEGTHRTNSDTTTDVVVEYPGEA